MEQNNFDALYDISRTLHAIQDPVSLLEKVLEVVITHLNAERGFVLLADPSKETGFTVAAATNFGGAGSTDTFAASSSVVRQVLATGEPVLTFDALTDERFESATSIVAQNIHSILCIPLRASDRLSGAVYVDSSRSRKAFTDDALKFLTIFGHLAAVAVENAQRTSALRTENVRLRSAVEAERQFPGIIGRSPAWTRVQNLIQRVLDVDAAVLLTGESGTGKELVARAIHDHGVRSAGPFVAINCSAIPEALLESELFGHVKGSFTGATGDKRGLVEMAAGGTLFLDEVAELPLSLQPKLLRLLQEKEFRRVGDTRNRTADIRIVAATNRDLAAEVKEGRLREDLYFRLNVVGIHLPPLRDRREDIPLLADHLLKRASLQYKRPVQSIHPAAMQLLLANPWKGNIREFQNVLERAVVLCRGEQLMAEDFAFDGSDRNAVARAGATLADLERQIIEATLAEMGGNRTRTAERLGVSLRWLQYRLKEWGSE